MFFIIIKSNNKKIYYKNKIIYYKKIKIIKN